MDTVEGHTDMETTLVTEGLTVRTADLERLCEQHDPRGVEFGCFLLHSSKGDAALAIHRAIEGMFGDPAMRAMQEETAECIRAVAVSALDLRLEQHLRREMERLW